MVTRPLFAYKQRCVSGHFTWTHPISVMLNDIQAVDSDSSTLVKFTDDLTLSVLVKEIQYQAPLEL